MVSLRSREAPQRRAQDVIRDEAVHDPRETLVRDLAGEELQKAVQLVGVAPQRRRELRWIRLRRGLERPHVYLQSVPELLDTAEHAHGVTFCETRVEQLDVVPDTCVDATARIDELEREVWGAALRAQPLLARYRVDALDDPLLGQLCDCAHAAISAA